MEQIQDIQPEAAPDEPASPSIAKPARPLGRTSDRLTESLIEEALEDGADSRPGRARREDGWTPERIRIFLNALAECGVVADAARAAGMSRRSAYALRARSEGCAFSLAWRAARLLARQRIADDLVSRAIHGCVDVIVRDGNVVEERHRLDNRFTMALLTRLEAEAAQPSSDKELLAARLVVGEFEQFVDIVCSGAQDEAASFVATREASNMRHRFGKVEQDEILSRAANYQRYGVGHPDEIDTSDLDPDQVDDWTEEQLRRAEDSGFWDRHQYREADEDEYEDEDAGADDRDDGERGPPEQAPQL